MYGTQCNGITVLDDGEVLLVVEFMVLISSYAFEDANLVEQQISGRGGDGVGQLELLLGNVVIWV